MDQTTDTFIIVKSGQDATPLAGSSSLAFPGSGAGLPGCEIPLELSCEREKDARLPAQPSGVARELIPPQGVTAVFCEPEAEKNGVKRGIIPL